MDFDPTAFEIAVTNLGNLVVVGPAALLVWLWLLYRRGLSAALHYQWPVAVTFVLTVCLKMVSRQTDGAFEGTAFALSKGAPSGHMAMSTVVYGGVALMLLRRGVEPVGLFTALVTVVGLAGVGITRVLLHAHMPADVIAGFGIGGLCAVWIALGADVPPREPARYVAELVVAVTGIVVLMHLSGLRFNSAEVM